MHRHVAHPPLITEDADTFVLCPLIEFARPLYPQLLIAMGDERARKSEMQSVVETAVLDDAVARATQMAQDPETFLPAYDVLH